MNRAMWSVVGCPRCKRDRKRRPFRKGIDDATVPGIHFCRRQLRAQVLQTR